MRLAPSPELIEPYGRARWDATRRILIINDADGVTRPVA
jgi:hypothetical protein